jgi:hypothetical protein
VLCGQRYRGEAASGFSPEPEILTVSCSGCVCYDVQPAEQGGCFEHPRLEYLPLGISRSMGVVSLLKERDQ